jgi:hypothetical protein
LILYSVFKLRMCTGKHSRELIAGLFRRRKPRNINQLCPMTCTVGGRLRFDGGEKFQCLRICWQNRRLTVSLTREWSDGQDQCSKLRTMSERTSATDHAFVWSKPSSKRHVRGPTRPKMWRMCNFGTLRTGRSSSPLRIIKNVDGCTPSRMTDLQPLYPHHRINSPPPESQGWDSCRSVRLPDPSPTEMSRTRSESCSNRRELF